MNAFDLTGKTFLVTGASSGLGRETAITISRYGGKVFITGRTPSKLDETFALLEGEGHTKYAADLTDEQQLTGLVDQLPELNGVVYSTGISDLVPAQFITAKDIGKNFQIGFEASVLLTTRLLRKKRLISSQCSLVFITSISTQYPFVGGALYISTKAAVEGYARVLALELAPRGIRVNCVAPGFVKGPMLDQTQETISAEKVAKIEERQPLGLGDPRDVANTIVFYLSDASKWITATRLVLGGG